MWIRIQLFTNDADPESYYWQWLDPTRPRRLRHPAPQSPPEHPPHTAHPRPWATQIINLRNTSLENSDNTVGTGNRYYKSILYQCLDKKGTNKWLLSATSVEQCCGSVTFDMDPDPHLWLTDPDSDPAADPAIFVSDLQDGNKKVFVLITLWRYHRYINFKDKKS